EEVETLTSPDREALPVGEVFGRTIAFNVVPHVEQFDPEGSGFTTEEIKMGDEFRKVLGIPDLVCAATAVRVPVVTGHGVSIYARFERPVSPEEARAVLAEAPGLRVVDDPEGTLYPTPLDSAGIDDVLVGRIRRPAGDDHALLLFAVGDNLRKGAALLAVHRILGEEFGHGSIVGSPPCLRVRIDPRSDGVSTGHAAVLWAVQISSEGHRSAQPGGMCSSGGTAPAGAWSSTSRSTVKPF